MSKVITISHENTTASKIVKSIQAEKKRLKEHLAKGGKLEDFKLREISTTAK